MAESIILYVADNDPTKIETIFGGFGDAIKDGWAIPNQFDYLILVYTDENVFSDYEPSEAQEVIRKLGSYPQSAYCLEFRPSKQNAACDLARDVIQKLLVHFHIVVDDCLENIWTQDEITVNPSGFLVEYYYRNEPNG